MMNAGQEFHFPCCGEKLLLPPCQKKRPCTDAEPFNFRQRSSLDTLDVLCRRAFLAIDYFKFYAFAFSESLEALALDRGMMDKYVLAAILFNKTKTF